MTTNLQEFIERQATPRQYTDMFAENRERQRLNMEKLEAEAKAAQEKAELEEKQRQATLTQAAKNIETPSTVNMFDSDYKVAQRMAEYLRDNLDGMSATPEGMREFDALSNQLTQFVQEGEQYYRTYYGTPEDESSGNTWMSAFKRMNDPSNPYQNDGMMDSRSREMYEQTLRDLDDAGAYDFEVSGGNFVIKKGEQSMMVGDFQRPRDPFTAALEPTPAMSAQDWFATRMPRNTPSREQAIMTAGALIRQDQRSQMDAARIYAEENELNYKEVMNNPAQMQEAIDNYVNSIGDSWEELDKANKKAESSETRSKSSKTEDKSNKNTSMGERLLSSVSMMEIEVDPMSTLSEETPVTSQPGVTFPSSISIEMTDGTSPKFNQMFFVVDDDGGKYYLQGGGDTFAFTRDSDMYNRMVSKLMAKGYSEKDAEDVFLILAQKGYEE